MGRARATDIMPDVPMIPGTLLAGIVALSAILVAGMMLHSGLVIKLASPAFAAMVGSMLLLAALRYSLRNTPTKIGTSVRDFSEYCLLFMAISLTGVVSTYPLAAVSSGWYDPALAKMDGVLGFDWNRWYAFVVDHPMLRQSGAVAYSTIYLSPAILLGYMAWHGERAAARRFLATFWLAATITLLLFPLFPAKGPLAAIWAGPIPYMPTTALYQSEIIPLLRDRLFGEIDMGALQGLVCAPSFHTVCGALYIGAAWPFARLRWPLIAMNSAMLLATPVEGNHYLSDMLLGLTVALLATIIVPRAMRLSSSWLPAAIRSGGRLAKAP